MNELAKTIQNSLLQDAEKQTYDDLSNSIVKLKEDKDTKLEELANCQRKIISLIAELNSTNSLIELQKQELDAEFQLQLNNLKEEAINNLKSAKQRLNDEIKQIQE